MNKLSLSLILFAFSLFFIFSTEANENQIKYNPVPKLAKIKITFADTEWNGTQIPSGQQCQRFGGNNPSTPRLIVKDIPPMTNLIIMEYSDRSHYPMDNGGHGKIGYRISGKVKKVTIPSIAGHSFELPDGFVLLTPQQAPSWDKAGAYMPPCSGGRGNSYYVTVNTVYQETEGNLEFKLLGQAVLELGKY